jgi:hypothetical protein
MSRGPAVVRPDRKKILEARFVRVTLAERSLLEFRGFKGATP